MWGDRPATFAPHYKRSSDLIRCRFEMPILPQLLIDDCYLLMAVPQWVYVLLVYMLGSRILPTTDSLIFSCCIFALFFVLCGLRLCFCVCVCVCVSHTYSCKPRANEILTLTLMTIQTNSALSSLVRARPN